MSLHSAESQTWLDVCYDFATTAGVDPDFVKVLTAFRNGNPRGGLPPHSEASFSGGFSDLEQEIVDRLSMSTCSRTLATDLAEDVDRAQADMFVRRLFAVDDLLNELGGPEARLLRVGLHKRVQDIRDAPRPHAHRIRALVDYFYSHTGRLYYSRLGYAESAMSDLLKELRWEPLSPGLQYARLEAMGPRGPVHANFLKADPDRVRIEASRCRQAWTKGVAFEEGAWGETVAAVSGGYFLYSENDIAPPSYRGDPVGLLVSRGTLLSPPVFRRSSLLVGENGTVALRPVSLEGVEIVIGPNRFTVSEVWNRARGSFGPSGPSLAIVSHQVVAVGSDLPIPLNGFVTPVADIAGVKSGDSVKYPAVPLSDRERVLDGIAGGPMLLRQGNPVSDFKGEDFWGTAPPITFSQDETGDQNLLARLAVGLDAHGTLVFAAVDGRDFRRALGMTLGELAELMKALGCHTAMNLDGGSSKRMIIHGDVADLPSTEIVSGEKSEARIRPLHTAILLSPK